MDRRQVTTGRTGLPDVSRETRLRASGASARQARWSLEDLYPPGSTAIGRHLCLRKDGVIVGYFHQRKDWGIRRQTGWQFCPPDNTRARHRRLRPTLTKALIDAAGIDKACADELLASVPAAKEAA